MSVSKLLFALKTCKNVNGTQHFIELLNYIICMLTILGTSPTKFVYYHKSQERIKRYVCNKRPANKIRRLADILIFNGTIFE